MVVEEIHGCGGDGGIRQSMGAKTSCGAHSARSPARGTGFPVHSYLYKFPGLFLADSSWVQPLEHRRSPNRKAQWIPALSRRWAINRRMDLLCRSGWQRPRMCRKSSGHAVSKGLLVWTNVQALLMIARGHLKEPFNDASGQQSWSNCGQFPRTEVRQLCLFPRPSTECRQRMHSSLQGLASMHPPGRSLSGQPQI